MRVVVDYQDEQIEFEAADDRVVGSFRGPSGIPEADRAAAIVEALEHPRDFPPFSKLFVPGDRVAFALDGRLPDVSGVLAAVLPIVRDAVGETGEIALVTTPDGPGLSIELPGGVVHEVHDPTDRDHLAYLATTRAGRRIYLNRSLTDADVVVPIGEFRFEPGLGCRGPWSVLFPALSDQETRREFAGSSTMSASADSSGRAFDGDEAFEVNWLLGSQFSLGLVPGRSGFAEVIAGLGTSVRDQGVAAVERDWRFQAESRAELVVAGVGRPGSRTGLEELVAAITAAAGLVQHGGKIAVLSRAAGEPGPALRRLIDAGEPRLGAKALRAHPGDEDHALAVGLNRALAWADVYLLSELDPQVVEDLSMIPLTKSGEASRLVASGRSCTFLSQADLVGVGLADDT
jgi:hypothetical protein